MKRIITITGILFLQLALIIPGAFAQVQVGTGTLTDIGIPIEPYWGYSYTQVIYLASEINASGTITQLKWYFDGTSLNNSNDWTIYIGHTSKTHFTSTSDWIPVSSMTQVYSGTFTSPSGPGWITFDITDWTYNGTDNIVVAVDENAPGYDDNSNDFYCSSVSQDRALMYMDDNNNPDPANPPQANGYGSYIANIVFDGITAVYPAPFSENFAGSTTPNGWDNSGTELWMFSTGAGYGASAAGDHTPGGGTNYAWIDGTLGIQQNALVTPYIDVSGLTTPALEFYFFSNNTDNPGDDNTLTVDFWDGAAWNNLLTYAGDDPHWQLGFYDLSGYNITGNIKVRFIVTGTANTTYYNDILVDDVSVDEMPSCPPPTFLNETNITVTSADLGWTENGTSTTWNIEYGPAGFTQGNGTTITGVTTNPYTLSGLTASTAYDWYVQADCGGGSQSTWTGPHTFTTTPAADPVPLDEDFENGFTYFVNDDGNNTDWTLETSIYHCGSQSAHNPYGPSNNNILYETGELDLSDVSTPYLFFWQIAKTEGGYDFCTVEVSTDGGNTYSYLPDSLYLGDPAQYHYWGEYFDENSYTDWGIGNETPDNTWWKKETFDLTPYKLPHVRFRFRLQSDASTQKAGWYLDDIRIGEPACPAPSGQTVSNTTTTSADLGWTENGSATTWNIEYGPACFTPGTGTMITGVTSNPYTLTGLSPAKTYDWYVQADCGCDQSFWTGPNTFSTNVTAVTSYPWTEDFEKCGNIPVGWSQEYVSGNVDWTFQSGSGAPNGTPWGAHSGSYNALFFSDNYNGDETKLVTLPLDLTGLTHPVLSFWHAQADWDGDQDELRVYYKTSAGGSWTLIPGQVYQHSIPDWTQETEIYLPEPSADYYIAFEGLSGYGFGVCLDDVTVEEGPACPAPSDLTATNITQTSADLGWMENGSSSTWNIEYGPRGFTQGNGTQITGVTTNPYTLTGLTASTTYDWYVQADCGGGSSSTWRGPATFTTVCDTAAVPYIENFDNVTTPDFPPCMTVENTNGDDKTWETTNNGLSPPNAARIRYNSNMAMDDWFFTQGLDLTGGVTYEVSFAYKAESSVYPEKLAVDWGNAAVSTAMSGSPIFENNDIENDDWLVGSGTFTPAATGTYFVGFHGHSDADMYYLYVDDVKVLEQVTTTTWNGSVDENWDNPANWNGGVPTSVTDVTIPPGKTHYPTVNTASIIASVTVQSDATGDASLILNNMLDITGDATVQRYITGGKWHDISASAQGQTLNSVFFNHNPDVWLREYNEYDNSRTYLTDLSDPMDPGAGFEIWVESGNNVTINFTGPLQNEDLELSADSWPVWLDYSGEDTLGYNLIGNPFPSPIDLDDLEWSLYDVSSSFWVWDPDNGTYRDWNVDSQSGSLTDGIVPMGQGFFVQTVWYDAMLTIPKDACVHSSQPYYKEGEAKEDDGINRMSLRALTDNGYDEMNIVFTDSANKYFDSYDTRKMFAFTGNTPQVYCIMDDERLSTDALPLPESDDYVVKVGYRPGYDGTQTLKAVTDHLQETDVALEDLVTGRVQDLIENPVYHFEAKKGDAPDRFILHFNPVITNTGQQKEKESEVSVYAYDGSIYIRSNGTAAREKKEVWVYDLFGRTVLETTIPPSTLSKIPVNRHNAVFVVRTAGPSGVTTTKVFVR